MDNQPMDDNTHQNERFRELSHYELIQEQIPVDKIAFYNGKLGVWEEKPS